LSDLWSTRGKRDYDLDDIMLLKVGRHLRPRPNFKIIVGREEGENRFMEGYRKRFTHMLSTSHTGPLVLLDGEDIKADDLELAARLTARFGQGRDADRVTVDVHDKGVMQTMEVVPMPTEQIPADWYL
jgi:tRNA-specific 2-thiouridylase